MRREDVTIRLANDEYFQAQSGNRDGGSCNGGRLVNDGGVPSLNQLAGTTIPIHAACLDVALRTLPTPSTCSPSARIVRFIFVHTRSRTIGARRGIRHQLAKYLSASSQRPANDVRDELEGLLDWLQPGGEMCS
jgi:hypothetical protein